MDGDAAIGRENDLCSGDELQQLGDIVRVGVAVAVDISLELARAGRDVVEQELCVAGIGVAVLVEVCSGARSLANRARSVSNITPA